MKLKHLWSLLLAATFLLCGVVVPHAQQGEATAALEESLYTGPDLALQTQGQSEAGVQRASAAGDAQTVQECLLAGFSEMKSSINISSFNIHRNSIAAVYSGTITANPRIFFVSAGLTFNYNASTGYVTTVFPKYLCTQEELPGRQAAFEAALQAALAQIPKDVSDVEKVLAAHDFVVCNARYSSSSVTAYGILVDGAANCQGYTRTLRLLLQELGVQCIQTGNASHVWNMVKLGDDWYHVDATWDDPTPNALGRVRHINLLCSDEVFLDNGHGSWSAAAPEASNTQYDDAFWRSVWTKFEYLDDLWYYITGRGGYTTRRIKSYDFGTGITEDLYSFTATWKSSGGAWIHNASLAAHNGTLYYNGALGVYRFDVTSRTSEPFVTESFESGSYSRVYEMEIIGNCLRYRIKASPNGSTLTEKVILLAEDEKTFEVKFDIGGEIWMNVPVPEGQTVPHPQEAPAREGYVFLSWQLGGRAYDFDTPVTQALTLTARWEEAEGEPEDIPTITVCVGEAVQAQNVVALEGNDDFAPEWSSSNEDVAEVDGSGTLYAKQVGETIVAARLEGELLGSCRVIVIAQPDNLDEETPEGTPEDDSEDDKDEPELTCWQKLMAFLQRVWEWIKNAWHTLFGWVYRPFA